MVKEYAYCAAHHLNFDGVCGICVELDILRQMSILLEELESFKINPELDYGIDGFKSLAEWLLRARGYSERASFIIIELMGCLNEMTKFDNLIRRDYDDAYDENVVTWVSNYAHLSWEERGSIFRVKTIDKVRGLRQSGDNLALAKSFFDQGKVLAESLYRARNDLKAYSDLVRTAEGAGVFV